MSNKKDLQPQADELSQLITGIMKNLDNLSKPVEL